MQSCRIRPVCRQEPGQGWFAFWKLVEENGNRQKPNRGFPGSASVRFRHEDVTRLNGLSGFFLAHPEQQPGFDKVCHSL